MVTLQHSCGILLLVYSVAVALPKERKGGRVNDYEEEFGLPSNIPGQSEKNIPVKFGRKIYESPWSTEDSESSEENDDESIRTRDMGNKRWSLSNALRLALNFVNKLRAGESADPVIEKNKNKNAPKSKNKNKSEDIYWQSFKKWLRKNKVLSEDDSLSSYILEHNSRSNDYNHKSYQKKPRRNFYKNFKSPISKNESFDEKSNRIRNSKPHRNNKNELPQAPKINNHGVSASEDQDSGELSTSYEAKQYDVYSDENRDSSKSVDKSESSNNLIKSSKNNKRNERKETVFTHFGKNVSTFGKNESNRQGINSHDVLKKHHKSKPAEEIYPETQKITSLASDSFHLLVSPKQRGTISYPQAQRKTSAKAISLTNFKTPSGESGLHKAPTKNANKQVAKCNQPNKGRNTLPNQNMLNPTTNLQPNISSFIERPTVQTSKNNQTNKLKTTDTTSESNNLNQFATNQSPTGHSSTTIDDLKYFPSTQSQALTAHHEKFRKKSKIAGKVSQVNSTSLQPPSKSTPKGNANDSRVIESVSFTTVSEYAPSSESQSKRMAKKKSKNSQITKKVVPTDGITSQTADERIAKETSRSFPVAKIVSPATISPSQTQEKDTLKEISNESNYLKNLSLTTIPESNSYLLKTSSKSNLKENPNDSRGIESVPHVTIPLSVNSSESQGIQGIRTVKVNSESSQVTEKLSQAALPVSSSSPQTSDKNENITKPNKNDSQEMKNVQFIREPIRASFSKPRRMKPLKENSKDSQINEKVLQPTTVESSSSQHIADEMIIKEASNDFPMVKSVREGSGTPRETVPLSIFSSKPQRTLKQNSKNSQMTETILKPAVLVNSSYPQTMNETIIKEASNDLPVDKNDSRGTESSRDSLQETMLINVSSIKPKNISTLKGNSDVAPAVIVAVNSLSQVANKNMISKASNDLPVDKSASPLTNSPLQSQEKSILIETTNTSHMRDSIIKEPFSVSQLQPQIENIRKENAKNLKINKSVSSSVVSSPQSNEKHILKENFKGKDILTKPSETPLKKAVYQKSTKTKNSSKKSEFEPNNLFTKNKDSDITSSENYNPDKFTSTLFKNKDSDIKNSQFEELEKDSYIISDETDLQSNENMNLINLSDRENDDESTELNIDRSTKYAEELKEKSQLIKNQSFASSSLEELTDKEVEDQDDDDEKHEKFDTFLQYIYKHSNSSYFQSLRKKSHNL